MSVYKMDDGTIVRTERAQNSWEESTHWDGHNHVSDATGSQWEHETLYLSAKGRWYVEHTSQWQGSEPSARYVDDREAAAWLLSCDHDVPGKLAAAAAEIEE